MINDILSIEYDPEIRMAFLKIGDVRPDRAAFSLPDGFGPDEVRELLLATGLVRADGEFYRLVQFIRAEHLSEILSEMLAQFDSPGVPCEELLEVQAAVEDYQSGIGSSSDIPLIALAWLDVMVRQDIAEEARSSDEIWSKTKFVVETKAHRDRRMKELLKRYSQQPSLPLRRMTPSCTTLPPNQVAQPRIG
jgi:hypothetical protein